MACKHSRLDVDVSDVQMDVSIHRADAELLALDTNHFAAAYEKLHRQMPTFWDDYTGGVLKICFDSLPCADTLRRFITNPSIRMAHETAARIYGDFSEQKDAFTDAFKHFKCYFPAKAIPTIHTFISEFGAQFYVGDEKTIGISLDRYLADDTTFFKIYRNFFPDYIIRMSKKDYLVSGTMRGIGSMHFGSLRGDRDETFLAAILREGKLQYFVDAMMPEAPDTIKRCYSAEQLKWCMDNEPELWTYCVNRKMLYNTDNEIKERFLGEAPYTVADGVPQESSPRLGMFLGWRMVTAYMDKHPEITLEQLMQETDYRKIMNDSGYKP